MALEALALSFGVLCTTANLPDTCSSRHILLFGLFPVACSTGFLFLETTGSTKTLPVLPTCKALQLVTLSC